ncbi:hypothetical protein A3Q56_04308 [Intoshia linei]|uniref:Uncharacterized protein n=1 Tax=Intoshia linei TaxID=1819745 RepID=A0A177B131_9BILA|nr:hypothetical protein A3Q56_04308 [Intoshia linei]
MRKTPTSKHGKSPYKMVYGRPMKILFKNYNKLNFYDIIKQAKEKKLKYNIRTNKKNYDKSIPKKIYYNFQNYENNQRILSKTQLPYRARKTPKYLKDYNTET